MTKNTKKTDLLKRSLIRTARTALFTAASYLSTCTILSDFKIIDFGFTVIIASGICFCTCIAAGLPEETEIPSLTNKNRSVSGPQSKIADAGESPRARVESDSGRRRGHKISSRATTEPMERTKNPPTGVDQPSTTKSDVTQSTADSSPGDHAG